MREREVITLPPPRWRKAIPTRVKLDVVIRQEGKCAETGEKLGTLKNTRFDHRPPLHERPYIAEIDDTDPPANDPAFIRAVALLPDREVTKADQKRMKKVDRLRRSIAEHDAAVSTKQPGEPRRRRGSIQSRGFDKRYRKPMNGKPELRDG